MPNRYSHAFVLSDYEKRGVFDSICQRESYRYHHRSSSPSFAPSSTRSSVSFTIETSGTNIPAPSTPKASPPQRASSFVNRADHVKQDSPPQPNPRPSPASPSSRTPSSVVTQIYKPQSPRSYFDSNSSQASHATASRPLSPSTELYISPSPLPTTLDYFDLDSSPSSEKTTPRSSLTGLTLGEMLLEAIPPSAPDRLTHIPYEESDTWNDEADDAVPPPISRHRRNTHSPKPSGHTQNPPRPSTPVPRPGPRQRTSFTAPTWTPPKPNNTNPTPVSSHPKPPSPRSTVSSPGKPTPSPQTHSSKHQNANNSRPTPPTLQRTRTDLNAEELRRWKKEVHQAKWRRGSWVGALVGLKGLGGRRGSRD